MNKILIVTVALMAYVGVVTGIKCHQCDSTAPGTTGCGTAFNPTAAAGVTQVDCTGTCRKVTVTDVTDAADPRVTSVVRSCQTPGKPVNSVSNTVSDITTRTTDCNKELCNGEPIFAENPISCYECLNTAACKADTFVPADVAVKACLPGQACVTIRKQNPDESVISVDRWCSDDVNAISKTVEYFEHPGGVLESRHYCSTDGCNNKLTSAIKPLKCYACKDAAACAVDPFNTGVNPVTCGPKQSCVTIRQEAADGTVIEVERKCGDTKTADGCAEVAVNTNTNVHTSTCYCNSDSCNSQTTSARRELSCYTCGAGATADACKADTFVDTVMPVKCAANMPCLTIRKENKDSTVVTVERKCATEAGLPKTGCRYVRDLNGDKESVCYCNSDKCNKEKISAVYVETPADAGTTPKSGAAMASASVFVSVALLTGSTLFL